MGGPLPTGWAALVVVVALCGAAATAQPGGQHSQSAPPAIYVADFELETETGEAERPPPPPVAADDLPGRARELVDLIASALVRDFTMVGIDARRLAPDEPLPRAGWLVRGVFVSVDEANRFRRLALRGGAGTARPQVVATVDDLVHGMPQPVYRIDRGGSGAAAAAITFNPYAIAVGFALSGPDLGRNVTRSAGEISREIILRSRQ